MASLLIVDDSPFQRGVIRKALQSDEHVIREAVNGRAALVLVSDSLPDCMILDLLMPEMGGLEVLGALQERGLDFPVIVATPDPEDTTRRACIEAGAAGVISKPVDERALRDAFEKALRSVKAAD